MPGTFLFPAPYSFEVSTGKHIAGFTMYFMVTFAIVAFAEAMHRAQKQAGRDADLLRTTLESIGDGVITTDKAGIVTNVNQAAEKICGTTSASWSERPLEDVLWLHDEGTGMPTESPVRSILRGGGAHPTNSPRFASGLFLLKREQDVRCISLTATPISSAEGTLLGAVVVFRDVTDEHRMVNEIREQTAAAQRMAADLGEAHRRKDEFLATLAHELRNPLAPVRTSAQLLRDADGDLQKTGEISSMIDRQVGQLARLVDDLLDVSNITLGKVQVNRKHVDLASTIHLAIEAATPVIDEAGQRLSVSMPEGSVTLFADKARVAQLIGNLLNNASKFSPSGALIELAASVDEEHVRITVKDEGIGIDSGRFEDIFELFVQVDTTLGRQRSGSGIGLTIVQKLVTMHGGTISVDSAGLGKGAKFTVVLPSANDKQPSLEPEVPQLPTWFKRILVVDDNVDAAVAMSGLLEALNFETAIAHDGARAIVESEKFQPQMVLLDIGMPVLDGYQTCRAIRTKPWGEAVKIIALTGWGRDEDRSKAQEAGFDAHLVKPVNYKDLLRTAAEVFGKSAPGEQSPPS